MKCKFGVADLDAVPVPQAGGPNDALVIQIGAVAAAKIHQPELILSLDLDEGMAAGNSVISDGHLIGIGTAERTGSFDRHPAAASILQPGRPIAWASCHGISVARSVRVEKPRLVLHVSERHSGTIEWSRAVGNSVTGCGFSSTGA